MKSVVAAAAVALGLLFAPVAHAETVDCQVTGILIIVALTGPVTVCSTDINVTHSTQIDPSLQVDPKLFSPAP
jgi:hypothetical protein